MLPRKEKSRPSRAYSYVRMSTDVQMKGDSLRRQLEASIAYATENGLELVEEEGLRDIGVSAFRGANVADGALGRFLSAANSGTVPRGSYLLVESLDRLSREQPSKAATLFLSIINAGVNIVTLTDRKVFTEGSDLGDLMHSLIVMSRAHEESLTKSMRVGAAWANKRAKAATQPLTKMCPAWLKLSDDRSRFDIIEERAAIIQRIFAESASGIGNYSITQRLNKQKVAHFGRSNGWHISYVAKILRNRAVIGEYQPHRLVEGERVADGDPIPSYFPVVVDKETFYRVQNAQAARRQGAAGRKGHFLSNLVSGRAKCAYCGAPMSFENKGKPPKGGTFLVCRDSKRGLGCEIARWRYDELEASFLAFVQELDLSEILGRDQDSKSAELNRTIAVLDGELRDVETQRDRTFEVLKKVDVASDFVATKLEELERRRAKIDMEREAKVAELAALEAQARSIRDIDQDFKKLTAALKSSTGDDLYTLRAQIADRIRSMCAGIYVAPLGPNAHVKVAPVNESDNAVIALMKKSVNDDAANRRFFAVEFEKSLRIVFPSDEDPARLDMMRYVGPSPGPAITLILDARDQNTF